MNMYCAITLYLSTSFMGASEAELTLGDTQPGLPEESYLAPPAMNKFMSKPAFHPFQKTINATKVEVEVIPLEQQEGQDGKIAMKITPLYSYKKRVWKWSWLRECCSCCCGSESDD